MVNHREAVVRNFKSGGDPRPVDKIVPHLGQPIVHFREDQARGGGSVDQGIEDFGVGRQWDPPRLAVLLEDSFGGDPTRPGAEGATGIVSVERFPQGESGLLEDIIAQRAVADDAPDVGLEIGLVG